MWPHGRQSIGTDSRGGAKLIAARLAADVAGTTTLVIARTDANAADLLTSDSDPYDADFVTYERTSEGFYRVRAGIDQAISRLGLRTLRRFGVV